MATRPSAADLVTLVYDPDESELLADLLRRRGVPGTVHACASEEEVARVIADVHVIVSGPFPNRLLAQASQLRWIQSLWAGIDSWLPAPIPAGVPLTRMSGVFGHHMSEYVFAHLLTRTQLVHHFHHAHRAGLWAPPSRTTTLAGRSLGVVGLGHVGRRIAELGIAFKMTVRALRRGPSDPDETLTVFPLERLEEFLHGLDVLVLAIPATAESKNLIGGAQLERLAPGAMLVNVGRGGVVNEDDVLESLDAGHLSHAVLDTFATEPLPQASPLWTHPGVTITPHISGPVYPEAIAEVVAANVEVFLGGGTPGPVADMRRGY